MESGGQHAGRAPPVLGMRHAGGAGGSSTSHPGVRGRWRQRQRQLRTPSVFTNLTPARVASATLPPAGRPGRGVQAATPSPPNLVPEGEPGGRGGWKGQGGKDPSRRDPVLPDALRNLTGGSGEAQERQRSWREEERPSRTGFSWKGAESPGLPRRLGLRGLWAAGATCRPSREPLGHRGGRPGSGGGGGEFGSGRGEQPRPGPGDQVWRRPAEWLAGGMRSSFSASAYLEKDPFAKPMVKRCWGALFKAGPKL